ncbi:hypothetical protein [Chryseobacterium piscicola]|uniref:hypothetical protein n=1 Tax=Chryseobacterium piscicola TaxID=551459 RepID=UPI000F4D497A|nr:hypothetical protein [Chryseobacterium piscicola]
MSSSPLFVNELSAECKVGGYVGPDGTSCIYEDSEGCIRQVTSHTLFWGLIKWETEEVVWC